MTFDLGIWHLTSLTYEGSHVASMTRVSLQLVFVHYISARGFLFELWYFKCAFSYTLLCTQHYLKCYISFITWPTRLNLIYMMHNAKIIIHCFGWPLTLVCDLWPHWHMAVNILHLLPKFHCNCSLYREVITQDKKCSPNCWRTHRHTDTQTDEACSHKVFSSNDLKITVIITN